MKSVSRRLISLSLFIILIVLVASCAPGEKYSLQIHLQEGKKYGFRTEMDQEIHIRSLGNATMKQNIIMNVSCFVEKVDADGNMSIKFRYDTVSLSQQSPTGNVSYDSTKNQSYIPDLAKGYAALVDKELTMLITPGGLVSDVKGTEKIYEAIIQSIEFPEGPERDQIVEQFREQFGVDSIREMMELSMAYLPKEDVSIGQRWRKDFEITKGLPMRLENTYWLESVDENSMRIDNESKILSLPETKVNMGMAEITYNMSGKQTGSMYIDPITGWVASGEMNQEIAGTMILGGEGVPGSGMKAPFTMKSTIRYVTFDGM